MAAAAAVGSMARSVMIRRAIAASWPALKMTPASSSSSSLGRAGGVEQVFVLDEASIPKFCHLVADHYCTQIKYARAAGVGLAGVAAVTLAGFGLHQLNNTTTTTAAERDQ